MQSISSVGANLPDDALWLDGGELRVGRLSLSTCASGKAGHLEAVLATVFGRPVEPVAVARVMKAIRVSSGGDQVEANIRIALAGLSRVPAAHAVRSRLAKASEPTAHGWTADNLNRALGFDEDVAKYDPSQARVPAGSGRDSGRWTTSGGSGSASAVTMAIALRASPLLAPELGGAAMSALAAFTAAAGFAATFGLLFVPSPNSVSSSGPLPGNTGASYDYNQDEGVLRILDAAGEVLAAGHRDKSGVFFDADTGVPFARQVGGSLVFDGAAMAAVKGTDDAQSVPTSVPWADTDDDEPKLCPDPGPDQPGSEYASDRAQAYQEQISRMINPQRPLEYGLAMNLTNPMSGSVVHFDECDERDGTMIEAKGLGFSGLLQFEPASSKITKDWLDQSLREVQAAGSRQVIWYFAEPDAARYATELFSERGDGRQNIVIKVQPAD